MTSFAFTRIEQLPDFNTQSGSYVLQPCDCGRVYPSLHQADEIDGIVSLFGKLLLRPPRAGEQLSPCLIVLGCDLWLLGIHSAIGIQQLGAFGVVLSRRHAIVKRYDVCCAHVLFFFSHSVRITLTRLETVLSCCSAAASSALAIDVSMRTASVTPSEALVFRFMSSNINRKN